MEGDFHDPNSAMDPLFYSGSAECSSPSAYTDCYSGAYRTEEEKSIGSNALTGTGDLSCPACDSGVCCQSRCIDDSEWLFAARCASHNGGLLATGISSSSFASKPPPTPCR